MRQLSIDQFENEGRRVTLSNQELQPKPPRPDRNGMFDRSVSDPGIHRVGSPGDPSRLPSPLPASNAECMTLSSCCKHQWLFPSSP